MTSILVTGGAGFIGAHVCKALAAAGFHPVTFDNLCNGHRAFVRWGPLVVADIHNSAAVAQTCRTFDVAGAIHLAAYASVEESMSQPEKYYQNNVVGTVSLLHGLHNAGVKTIVFSSSCAVYGVPLKQPINEDAPLCPVNPYGRSKLAIEWMLSDYARACGVRSTALRYFNACGADEEAEIGELRLNETHLIPRALMSIQGHLDDFRVRGTDYPTADGTAVRDYIHVSDLSDAHVRALKLLLAGEIDGAFNLGTGKGHSVAEVLAEIARLTRAHVPTAAGARRPGDPPVLVADAERARERLGFVASRSDLTTIIRTAWAWHQKAHPAVWSAKRQA